MVRPVIGFRKSVVIVRSLLELRMILQGSLLFEVSGSIDKGCGIKYIRIYNYALSDGDRSQIRRGKTILGKGSHKFR